MVHYDGFLNIGIFVLLMYDHIVENNFETPELHTPDMCTFKFFLIAQMCTENFKLRFSLNIYIVGGLQVSTVKP